MDISLNLANIHNIFLAFFFLTILKCALKTNCILFINRNAQDSKLLKVAHFCAVSNVRV